MSYSGHWAEFNAILVTGHNVLGTECPRRRDWATKMELRDIRKRRWLDLPLNWYSFQRHNIYYDDLLIFNF